MEIARRMQEYQANKGLVVNKILLGRDDSFDVMGSKIRITVYPNSHHGSKDGDWTYSGFFVDYCPTLQKGKRFVDLTDVQNELYPEYCSPDSVKNYVKVVNEMRQSLDYTQVLFDKVLEWYINN